MTNAAGWALFVGVLAFLAFTAQPINAPASCAGKVLCLFIVE